MKHNRQFDDYIKHQFSNYSADVHPRIWEKIIAEKDKKRPTGFWFSMFNNRSKLLVLGLIIALSSGGTWLYNNNITAEESRSQESKSKRFNKKVAGREEISPAFAQVDDRQLDDTIATAHNPSVVDDIGVNKHPVSFFDGKTIASITSPSPETDSTNEQVVENKTFYSGSGIVLVNTSAPEPEADEYPLQGGTLLGRLTYHAEKYTVKRTTGNKKEPLRFSPVVFLPGCPSIEKDAAGNKKYVELFASPDYAFRSLQDTANSDYLQKRKESTKFHSAFSAGVRYTRVFNNSMSVRGGVNFSQINERFTFKQGNIVHVIYIINNNSDTIGSYSTSGSRYKSTSNRYRSIDIPLMIGYELGNGKLHTNINAGPVINIYSWQKGDVLDASGNPVSITTGKNSSPYQFKTNAGISFMGSVSVYYKLNERLHIMAEPYFRYNLSAMNKESITLKQKYHTAGLRLGIRLDLK